MGERRKKTGEKDEREEERKREERERDVINIATQSNLLATC